MNPEQILLFETSHTKGRANNDANNITREKILEAIVNPPEDCLNEPEYGGKWRTLYAKFDEKIREMTTTMFDRYIIERRAGRNYNYDFLVSFFMNDQTVDTAKVEFKYGAKNIVDLPQFYQKSTTWEIVNGVLYHEFFYDRGYLAQMLALDPNAPEMIDRETYLRFVKQTNYDCHPFFRYLYDSDSLGDRKKIVKESIANYLVENEANVLVQKFQETIHQTQEGKKYLLYFGGEFRVEEPEFISVLHPMSFEGIVKKNTYVVRSGDYLFRLLLRWKNHQGVLNPAWQVSVKRGSSPI